MRSHAVRRGRAPFALLGVFCLVSAMALPLVRSAFAGPWSMTDDGYYTSAQLSWLSTGSFYDGNGTKTEAPFDGKFQDRTISMRAEYGLNKWTTLDLGLPLRFLQYDDDIRMFNDFNNGFGDARLGLRRQFLEGRTAGSAQLDVQLPTGYSIDGFGRPPMGRGPTSYTLRALVGRTFAPKPLFAQAEIGYRKLTGNYSDELVAAAAAGFWPSPRILVLGEWDWQEHTADEKPFVDFFRYGAQAQYRLRPNLDLIGGVSHIGGGQNVSAGTALILGVALKGNGLGAYQGPTAGGYPDAK